MTSQIIESSTIESVVIQGDLSKLSPDQRVQYYRMVCQSVGLNPLTRPFDYIVLNSKLTLYANKGATDQLRKNNGISIAKPDIQFQNGWIVVTVVANDSTGRTDSDIGVVSEKDMRGDFGNALMKAVTKAKRRVTLSMSGLGMLDETEVETIPDARPVPAALVEAGEVQPEAQPPKQSGNGHTDVDALYQAVVDAGLSDNIHSAKNALGKCKTGYDTPEKAVAWMRCYRGWRDMGADSNQAADSANKGELPK